MDFAAVVIGRNEGPSLRASLDSVRRVELPLVYVDSGSSDGSVSLARELEIPTVELDHRRPFSAARARNEGVTELVQQWPGIKYVLFLDGDCELASGFPAEAIKALDRDPSCAIVTGHLHERHPEASTYNRLCHLEWRSPAGSIEDVNRLGGIMAIRVAAFQGVDGFHEAAIAGEEPDLGIRLKMAGYSMMKLDTLMATHDARMTSFRQWWRRSIRGGHAIAQRYSRHGRTPYRDGRRELLSDLFWGLALPVVALSLAWVTRGASLLLLGGYAVLGLRIYRYHRRQGLGRSDAVLITRYTLYGKFAHVIGIARFWRNRARGKFEIIEYK